MEIGLMDMKKIGRCVLYPDYYIILYAIGKNYQLELYDSTLESCKEVLHVCTRMHTYKQIISLELVKLQKLVIPNEGL